MWDQEDIEAAIAAHPAKASRAIEILSLNGHAIPEASVLDSMAILMKEPREVRWVAELVRGYHLDAFGYALQGLGVSLARYDVPANAHHFKAERLARFAETSSGIRCKVLVGGTVRGSGIVVGPSLILTAWHVIASGAPDQAEQFYDGIEVEFASGVRRTVAPSPPFASPCTMDEYAHQLLPSSDQAVADAHDLALLRLESPIGLGATFPALAPAGDDYLRGAVMLAHFPGGEDQGLQYGKFTKIRKLRARWGHDMQTADGSSGGACFDTAFQLVGIHQGRAPRNGGRLVPAQRFPRGLIDIVEADTNPTSLWSLDATLGTSLVIGRELFIAGYHAGRRGPDRVRGIWVRRLRLGETAEGLGFTFEILRHLVARSPQATVVRLTFDSPFDDLAAEIARRVGISGWGVADLSARPGVAEGHTQPEAQQADRGRRIAQMLQGAAQAEGSQLWIYIDHPATAFGDADRAALEGFVAQALVSPNVRLVLAGFEDHVMPGVVFGSPAEASGAGQNGFVVELVDGFRRHDLMTLVERALAALQREGDPDLETRLVEAALQGLGDEDGLYPSWRGRDVSDRLRLALSALMQEAAA